MSGSLRSDCCSPSLRNAVRLHAEIRVHLRRNTQKRVKSPKLFTFLNWILHLGEIRERTSVDHTFRTE